MDNLKKINKLLSQPNAIVRHADSLVQLLHEFTVFYDDPVSVIGKEDESDDYRLIVFNLLRSYNDKSNTITTNLPYDLELLGARMIKILLRKPVNRASLGRVGMIAILNSLKCQVNMRNLAAAEICNAILNSCYDILNVNILLDEGAIPSLLGILNTTKDAKLQSSILGVLQGVFYTSKGRNIVRSNTDLIDNCCSYLSSDNHTVRARTIGVIHNLSVDVSFIKLLRESEGLLQGIVLLLKDPSVEVCQAAALVLQNASRESESKLLMMNDLQALPFLTDLLFCDDITCQAAATGALLNLFDDITNESDRNKFKAILTDGIVLAALKGCIFD